MESSRAQEALLAMLTENLSLRSLTVENVRDNAPLPMSLPACIFQETSNIEELAIERCTIDAKGSLALAQMIQRSHALKSLRLSDVIFDEGGLAVFSDALLETSKGGLERLEISNANLSKEDRSVLLRSIAGNTSLTSVSLDHMNLGLAQAPQLAAIIHHNQQLKTLSLRENNLNGKSIEFLAESIGNNSSLQHLSLAFNPVGDDGAMHLAECLTRQHNLQILDLDFAEIWHKGCLALAKSLSRMVGLQRLDLGGNDIENCAEEMLKSVKANLTITHVSGSFALTFGHDDSVQTKQWKKVDYFLRLNRANRRLLTTPMTLSLWPHVLERSNNDVDVLYFMLTHTPCIVQQSGNATRLN